MLKYATTLASSQNKKLSGQHLFLYIKATNDVVQFANNSLNQLQTNFNTRNKGI
jgi:hypothetical protein